MKLALIAFALLFSTHAFADETAAPTANSAASPAPEAPRKAAYDLDCSINDTSKDIADGSSSFSVTKNDHIDNQPPFWFYSKRVAIPGYPDYFAEVTTGPAPGGYANEQSIDIRVVTKKQIGTRDITAWASGYASAALGFTIPKAKKNILIEISCLPTWRN